MAIAIEVRDSEGKLISDKDGIKRIDLKIEDPNINMEQMLKTLSAWMPDRNIEIIEYAHNSISGTWMEMRSVSYKPTKN
ncbi:hypothetical protein EBU91_04955 [bacterium]|nr:hypothetical protein [bacterium]